MRGTDTLT